MSTAHRSSDIFRDILVGVVLIPVGGVVGLVGGAVVGLVGADGAVLRGGVLALGVVLGVLGGGTVGASVVRDGNGSALVSSERQRLHPLLIPPPLDGLRLYLQTYCPVLYAQVLEPTLADIREEHSAALAEGNRVKACWILLQGCGALAAAAVCQLGFSLLGRIAALWKARSPK